jgi:hypothetical protein
MISQNPTKNPAEPLLPALLPSKAEVLEVPVLDGGATIETAATGTGNGGDPGGTDTKPPGVTDYNFDLLA